jgi:hypothetical protein
MQENDFVQIPVPVATRIGKATVGFERFFKNKIGPPLPPVNGEMGPRLYQLQNQLVYPSDNTAPPSTSGAIQLEWDSENNKWEQPSGDNPPTDTLFLSAALQKSDATYIGLPTLPVNTYVWAYSCPVSGNWEILWDRACGYRAQLLEDLDQGGSAQAVIWEGDSGSSTGLEITVYDWLMSAGDSMADGTKIFIQWFQDDQQFWVTNAACDSGSLYTQSITTQSLPPSSLETQSIKDIWRTV